MVTIINFNDGIKELIYGYQNCNATHILMFGGYVKGRESLHTQVIIIYMPFSTILIPYQGECT